MRFVRCIEDTKGDLVEFVYYCSAFCYDAEADPELRDLPGGAWPCLDESLARVEPCCRCEALIGTPMDEPSERDEDCVGSLCERTYPRLRSLGRPSGS